MPDLREALLIVHIFAALSAAAGTGAVILGMLTAGSSPDVPTVLRTARLQALGGRVTAISLVVVLLIGIWLVIENGAIEFSQAWISASFALWIITMAIGGALLDRQARRLRILAADVVDRGETTSDDLQDLWASPLPRIGAAAMAVAFLVFLYLMVSKPGL